MAAGKGLLIDLEGIDGSGKAVQSQRLKKWLESQGYTVKLYSYPDIKSDYGKVLDKFLDGKVDLDLMTQVLTFAADISKDQGKIRGEIDEGKVVVLDRYVPSTVAYQVAHGLGMRETLDLLERVRFQKPDLIALFDIEVKTAVERRKKKKGERKNDRHDANKMILTEVRKNYLRLYKRRWLSPNWVKVNGERTIDQVNEELKKRIKQLLE